MKISAEFITNSSCASFVVPKKYLNPYQIEQIKNHIDISEQFIVHRGPQTKIYNDHGSAWNIEEFEDRIEGDTSMDNFDMTWFLLEIGVNEDHFEMHGCYGD